MMETLDLLRTWTPFLLGGFAVNIGIAILATAIGTGFGAILALLRFSRHRSVVVAVDAFTSFIRNVPTLVWLFFLATLTPNEINLTEDVVVVFPPWLKASIALSASPLGFTSWNLYASVLAWRRDERNAALLFIPNWLGGFLITLLASSVSSLVGVSEIVGRCNTIISATGASHMIPIYLYASIIFFAFSAICSAGVAQLKMALARKIS